MTVNEALRSNQFSEGQKFLIRGQYNRLGGFYTTLFLTIQRADAANLSKLALGFPVEVNAFRDWSDGEDYTADLVDD